MPSYALTNCLLSSIIYTNRNPTPKELRLFIRNLDEVAVSVNTTTVYGNTTGFDITYQDTPTATRTIAIGKGSGQRIGDVTIVTNTNNQVVNLQIATALFGDVLLKLGKVKRIRINFSDSSVTTIDFTQGRYVNAVTPDLIAAQTWTSYLSGRSITVRGINAQNNIAALTLTHNLDTFNYIWQITEITNFTATGASPFPITLRARDNNYRLEGQFSTDNTPIMTIKQFPYLAAVPTITARITTESLVTPIPEPEPELPIPTSRQRFSITSIELATAGTSIIIQIHTYPDPIQNFTSLTIEKSSSPTFNTISTRTYNQQVSSQRYGDSLPAEGVTYFRVKLLQTGNIASYSNIWKVERTGNNYVFTEFVDYTDILAGMKVLVTGVFSDALDFKIEDDNFLSFPIDQLKITCSATGKDTRNGTVGLDGTKNFINVRVSNLDNSTVYNCRISVIVETVETTILTIQQSTAIQLQPNPTPEQIAIQAEDILIKEQLPNNEANMVKKLPRDCQQRVIEYMLGLKSVASGNISGIDRNTVNADIGKAQQKRATRYSIDSKIELDDLIDDIAIEIPEPNEDTDLVQEYRF